MSSFVPTKRNLREALLFCFHLKKLATESLRLLSEAYGDYAPLISICEYWFRRFKSGDFDLEDKERPSQPKKFEDEELKALLDEDQCQTLKELAEALNVTEMAVSKRLKSMGMVQKQGNWVPYELKPRDIERRFSRVNCCFNGKEGRVFCIVSSLAMDTLRQSQAQKIMCKPGQPSTSTAKPNIHRSKVMLCIWWDQKGVVYYELLKPGETITGDRYRQQLVQVNRELKEKRPEYAKRHDKVIFQHDNARPHVAKPVKETLELGCSTPPAVFTRHCCF